MSKMLVVSVGSTHRNRYVLDEAFTSEDVGALLIRLGWEIERTNNLIKTASEHQKMMTEKAT